MRKILHCDLNNFFASVECLRDPKLKNAGIIYKSAGENIAGNNDFNDAINSWFESIDHRKNLLSNKFNNIGIGITKSNTYGYIFVILFIEK